MRAAHAFFAAIVAPLVLLPFAACVSDSVPDAGTMPDGAMPDNTVAPDTGTGGDGMMGMDAKADGPCVIEGGPFSGQLDPNFNSGVHTGLSPNALAIGSPAGNIFVAGQTANCPNNNTNQDFAVMKYSPAGQIVSNFGTNGRACAAGGANNGNDFAYAVTVDNMGRVVLAGTFRTANDANQNAGVMRFDTNGNLDTTFGNNGRFTFSGNFKVALAIRADNSGKLIVVGSNESPFVVNTTAFLARLTVAGALDIGFNGGNYITDTNARGYYGVVTDAQDNIYVTGSTTAMSRDIILKKYNALGALDTTFGSGGTTTVSNVIKGPAGAEGRDIMIAPNGGLWAMAAVALTNNEVGIPIGAAFTLNGIADPNTFPNSAIPGRVGAGSAVVIYDTNYQLRSIASQCDGKVLLAGRFDYPDAAQDMGILRFLANGGLDTTFGDGGVGRSGLAGDDVPVGIAQDSTGGLVMAGQAGLDKHVLARFLP